MPLEMIREKVVQDDVVEWLKVKGFRVNQKILHARHGVDIKAYHKDGREYFIECKGEVKGEGAALDSATGLGQLLFRMAEVKGPKQWQFFYLAIPKTRHFLRQIRKFSKMNLRRFHIRFLLVSDTVEEIRDCSKI